jgi:hypothetical protein
MTDLDPITITPSDEGPYEPATDAAPAVLVRSPGTALRQGTARWLIAIGLVALVIAASAAVAILVAGRAPDAKVLGYVPDGTVMYGEVRLDLPGDQRQALGSFLSRFPGFADQAALEGKLSEVMDRFVVGLTNGDQTYTRDIEPWFDGELAFSVGPLPDPGTSPGGLSPATSDGRFLVLGSVKDPAGATAWFKGIATASGATMSDEAYGGADLILLASEGGHQGAFAVLAGKVAVIGDVESVRAAVDTNGSGPFVAQADPAAALAAADTDHIGFMYVALAPLLDWASRSSDVDGPAGSPAMDLSSGFVRGLVPDWAALVLRVEGDALILESAVALPDTRFGPTENRSSTVMDHVPAGALLVAVKHDHGATLLSILDAYRSEPEAKSVIEGIDQVGGTAGAIGWIGDSGVVVNRADPGFEGGLVIVPTDRAAAERTFTNLRTLISLGGAQAGISVRDEPYAGATITIVDLGNLAGIGALAGLAGIPPDVFDPGSAVPSGHLELAYAITDQIVVIGSDVGFVKHVLDTTAAGSIAATDRYRALSERVGDGIGIVFVDFAAIRGSIESALADTDAAALARYEQDVKPYLTPFDALIASGSVKGDIFSAKVIVTVK